VPLLVSHTRERVTYLALELDRRWTELLSRRPNSLVNTGRLLVTNARPTESGPVCEMQRSHLHFVLLVAH